MIKIKNLHKKFGKQVIFNDLNLTIDNGDKIAIMRDGEIIQLGTPLEIINKPADDFVAEFTEGITGKRFEELQAVGA